MSDKDLIYLLAPYRLRVCLLLSILAWLLYVTGVSDRPNW